MKLENIPFQRIDWSAVVPTRHAGETGVATWRTREVGNVRVRLVEYSAGYVADHWCERLSGELVTELRDGRTVVCKAGDGYIVADDDGAHRSRSEAGATLYIVD
jgi:hypothetical protein